MRVAAITGILVSMVTSPVAMAERLTLKSLIKEGFGVVSVVNSSKDGLHRMFVQNYEDVAVCPVLIKTGEGRIEVNPFSHLIPCSFVTAPNHRYDPDKDDLEPVQ